MKNKKIIVVISVILILAISSASLAYLYMMTDIFKSNKELFTKYFAQNIESFEKIMDLKAIQTYKDIENETKYELETNMKIINSEGGEISNPLNNLAAKLDVQKNNDEQYVYANAQLLYENEQYLEAELIKEQEQYGIKFPDVAKKFVTIQNNENIETIANDMGIDVAQLETLINIIDGNGQITSEEQKVALKDKYLNIITTGISNGVFDKQKNALITYNNVTTETNAYSVMLSGEQVEKILIELLNNAKNETEILDKIQIIDKEAIINQIDERIKEISEEVEVPTVKVTVYENAQQTIRTVLEIGIYKITIQNTEKDGVIQSNITYSNNNEALQYNTEINKTNTENQEKFEVIVQVINGKEDYTITFLNEMNLLDNEININTNISQKQDITTQSIVAENKINIGNDFEKAQTLSSNNYLLLNNLEQETRKTFLEQLKQRITEKVYEKINLLNSKFIQTDEEVGNTESEEQIPQVEINKFNAKFEFYTGDEVSVENVKALLEIVRNNISSHAIMIPEAIENTESTEEPKTTITIYIEKDKMNEESMTKILEQIKDNEKYKISISYKEGNGLIDYLTITEI